MNHRGPHRRQKARNPASPDTAAGPGGSPPTGLPAAPVAACAHPVLRATRAPLRGSRRRGPVPASKGHARRRAARRALRVKWRLADAGARRRGDNGHNVLIEHRGLLTQALAGDHLRPIPSVSSFQRKRAPGSGLYERRTLAPPSDLPAPGSGRG